MKVIVMGCGRVGEQLCHLLDDAGHDVTIIDANQENLDHLSVGFRGKKIRGVGFDKDVLILAGIENADGFAATSPSDNANIIAARIARNIFHVPHVVTRLYDPRRAEIYRRLGLVTISMISWGAERINDLLTHTELDPIISFGRGEASLISIEIPALLEGHRVNQLAVAGEINVVAITRDGEAILPTSGIEFKSGDIIYVVVLSSAMNRLEALLGM
jgi:trk system potassium uptake protein TrkA